MGISIDIDPAQAATFALTILTLVVATLLAAYFLLDLWAAKEYEEIRNYPPSNCDIDAFAISSPPNKLKCVFMHKTQIGNRTAREEPIQLECTESAHVDGLYVSRKVDENATDNPIPLKDVLAKSTKKNPPVVVATIRMGFGHHRLAYSACSWALENGHTTIFHDLLNIKSEESALITSLDS
ncbi:MAG: hypothetical protein SGILL_010412, partial [Bacillariaceae sp.]